MTGPARGLIGRYGIDAELTSRLAASLFLGKVVSFMLLLLLAAVFEFGFASPQLMWIYSIHSNSMHAVSLAGGPSGRKTTGDEMRFLLLLSVRSNCNCVRVHLRACAGAGLECEVCGVAGSG